MSRMELLQEQLLLRCWVCGVSVKGSVAEAARLDSRADTAQTDCPTRSSSAPSSSVWAVVPPQAVC